MKITEEAGAVGTSEIAAAGNCGGTALLLISDR